MANKACDPSSTSVLPSEQTISLSNGRKIHWASAGTATSKIVVLMFSGYLSVGKATDAGIPDPPFTKDTVHWISPTIPGNGETTGTPRGVSYHQNLCEIITALLEHDHPSDNSKGNAIERLYVAGGSYGSVAAQMLYGAPYSIFPFGRKIAGMLLLAPFSPFRLHKDYAKQMTWANWISVGPPSQWIPFRIVPRLLSVVIAWKCKSLESTKQLYDDLLFKKMSVAEREKLETYAQDKLGINVEQLKEELAKSGLKCMINWDGFLEGPDVLHSDWGFEPASLDEQHQKPVFVVLSKEDELGDGMGRWLVEHYGNKARLEMIDGGHIAALYSQDVLWSVMVEMADSS